MISPRYGNSDWANPENVKDIVNTYAKNCTTYRYIEATCQENNLSTCFDTSKEISCTNYVHDMKSDDAFWSLSSEYGGFQLEFVSISQVISHMTCYKFKCSHWLKLQHSDWREYFNQ